MDEYLIDRFLDENRDEFIEDIKTLIRIPSVSCPSEDSGFPFGTECARVLDTALKLGSSYGFEIENHDYYGGSILFPGTEKREIGIFAHLDVVPSGDGWMHPPYDPYVSEGWLFGRGSRDNKGAAVAALYAMRFLKESGVSLKHTIRLFTGCSEENGMRDIRYFLKKIPAPEFSIVPDASFSVCYSEKGIAEADFSVPLPEGIIEFTAGAASNSVAADAKAVLAKPKGNWTYPDSEEWSSITISDSGEHLIVEAKGQTAHAAFPEGSVNAAVLLAAYLCESGMLTETAEKTISLLKDRFFDYYGSAVGIDYESKELGKLTIIGGMTRTKAGKLVQNVNIRYPAEVSADFIKERLESTAEAYGWSMTDFSDDPPSYVDPNSVQVQILDRICKERLGADMKPYTMGGGTYARRLPNAVAYGPGIQGQPKPGPEGHGGGHQPDEGVWLKSLEDAIHIYIQAISELDQKLPEPL